VAERIRAFIIAQTRLYRDTLALCLAQERSIAVAGAFATDDVDVTAVAEAAPDVILLDLASIEDVRIARALTAAVPYAALVGLAVPDTAPHVITCAESGVTSYVPRDASYAEMVNAIERASRGEAFGSPHVVAGLMRRVAVLAGEREYRRGAQLTRRELQIVQLIDDGRSNKEIATQLSIELATVKNHVHHILEKLQVTRRGEAAALVRRMCE
jgi:DNA-binding NarL/FixJ family response regulator